MAEPNELKAFLDLYEELSKPNDKSPKYLQFLDKLDRVNKKMSAMYLPDKYGRIALVTEADRAELLKLHEELGVEAEKVLADPGEMRAETLDTVKRLNGLNNSYHRGMRSYDPAEKKALHTIHEEMRAPVIDTRNAKLKAQLGGAISKRQPLTFLDPDGKEISGVFIPEKYENGQEKIADAVKKASQTAAGPNGKRLFKSMLQHFKDQIADEDEQTLFNIIERLGESLKERGTNPAEFTPKSISDYIANHMEDDLDGSVQDEIGAETLSELSDALNANYHSMLMNQSDAKIEAGGRIDTRNAAMSSVAGLLGVSHVIARSTPMQIIDAQGNKVNGTFMMEAKGMDPDDLPPEAEKVNLDCANNTSGKAFKDAADLQILDYICGNVDRHPSNFFLKFDKKGKLAGIQGIDNDCSFGTFVPKFGEGFNRLVGTVNLKVMSESMYHKIRDLTPAQLKFSLRGYGLSEAEMDAACQRLRHIKAMTEKYAVVGTNKPKKNKILIVPDDKFKDLKLEDLTAYKDFYVGYDQPPVKLEANVFSMIHGNLKEFKDMRREQEAKRLAEKKQRETLRSEIAIGSDNRANPGAIVKNAEQAEYFHKEMDKRTNPWKLFWKSSPAYEKMEKATQEYFKYQRRLKQRLVLAKDPVYTGKAKDKDRIDWEAVVSKEDMKKMRELARKMYEAANAYCEGKRDLNLEKASTYQKNRLDIGQMSRDFAKKAMGPLTEKEEQTLEANEKLAMENEARTKGNRKEAEDLAAGGPVLQ